MKSKKPASTEKYTQKKLTPREAINKSMEYLNFTISDEDFKNLKIGSDAVYLKKKEEEKPEDIKKETGKKPPDPYSILDE